MKYYKQAEEVASNIVKSFANGNMPKALSQVFISGIDRHCDSYSYLNRFIVAISGYSDARGFNSWKKVKRYVKKGEKAIKILAPVMIKKEEKDKDGKTVEKPILIGFRAVPVFGYEQTEGEEIKKPEDVIKFLEELPFKEVSEKWGIDVGAYNCKGGTLGVYSPNSKTINLGVKNLSTWCHELAHAAEDKLGYLKMNEYSKSIKEKALCEISAEFTGAVLLTMIGKGKEADIGGAYEYIKNWSMVNDKPMIDICTAIINRVCKTIEYIMTEAEELSEEVAA